MIVSKQKKFKNGTVYALSLSDGMLIETTDTFLPLYTKDAVLYRQNYLRDNEVGSRKDRWMIGVSVMSGCPVRCKFCATGNMKRYRNLSAQEIVDQVLFIVNKNDIHPGESQEFKINYTRMGEPFLNIDNVKKAVMLIQEMYPNAHHYISTIGIENADYSWIKDNITLQISLHSLVDGKRDRLIPYKHKQTIQKLGEIRTKSNLKTTLNLTLVDQDDFNIDILREVFDPRYFFIKLSPINTNSYSEKNHMGSGVISATNIL